MFLKKITIVFLLFILSIFNANAQEIALGNNQKYILGGIEVTGIKSYSEQAVIAYTELRIGQEITLPGEDISRVINKLWGLGLFSDINFYVTNIEGNTVYLELNIQEVPSLNNVKVQGIKQKKIEPILKDTELKKGKKVTESFLTNTKNYLINKYKKEGYLNTKVHIITTPDTTESSAVNMLVNIDLGEKVKVQNIGFTGNDAISAKKLRKALKNTKKIVPGRFWKKSKYISEDFKEDLVSLIDYYKENGYRDARIIEDTLAYNNDNTIDIKIKLEEGNKYYFGDIRYIGNTVYSDRLLGQLLGIKKGDTYNGVLLKKRIDDPSKPDGENIANLYQNNGYLFSQINPVEVSAINDTINFEIRILEGKPAYFNKISVTGNEKTNDHVIYRELRTKPGQLYSKENIIRTIRELSQMQFFDPEQIVPKVENPDPNSGTVDIKYELEEKGSSQIELQGGYGGGGFIGTLGLSFNNFAIKDLFNKKAYKPVPMGDGQSLALRLQASRFFQTYSFSFAEPWMGGKEPVQFSVSLSHTKQFLYDYLTGNADKDRRFNISGITVGIAKRLRVPDDYFSLSQAVSYQHYNLKNYNTALFTFGDGFSNSLAYTIALSRNSSGPNPIYPLGGNDFTITAKLSPPYSLLDNTDYKGLAEERKDAVENNDTDKIAQIDQQRFKWLEYYKVKFKGNWYTNLVDKLVLKTGVELGYLGAYNNHRGVIPFERFFVGGDGLGNYTLDGRENIQLRGYPNQSLSDNDGSIIYNKFSMELRYPLTLKQTASIYGLAFLEGGGAYNNFKNYNPFELQRSAGLGLRIFMPAFGLLGIDFGYGFDPIPGSTQPNGWETHFIIGQQF